MSITFNIIMRVTSRLAIDFICGRCERRDRGMVEPMEELCDEVDTVKGVLLTEETGSECKWRMYIQLLQQEQ